MKERADVLSLRKYIGSIKDYYDIVCKDETWVSVNHEPLKELADGSSEGRQTPLGKEHCITGILPACHCVIHLVGRNYQK